MIARRVARTFGGHAGRLTELRGKTLSLMSYPVRSCHIESSKVSSAHFGREILFDKRSDSTSLGGSRGRSDVILTNSADVAQFLGTRTKYYVRNAHRGYGTG